MSTCWIVGRRVVIQSNSLEYVGQPFIVFETEADANEAADLVEKVSGERPIVVESSFCPDRSKRP